MENNFFLSDEMLWDYADGFLDTVEQNRVDAYLLEHPEHHIRLQSILLEKKSLQTLPFEMPKADFEGAVMAQWAKERAKNTAFVPKDWVVSGIFGFLIFGIVFTLGVIFANSSSLPQLVTDVNFSTYLNKIEVIKWLRNPITQYSVYFGILYLSLQLLDKTIQTSMSLDDKFR